MKNEYVRTTISLTEIKVEIPELMLQATNGGVVDMRVTGRGCGLRNENAALSLQVSCAPTHVLPMAEALVVISKSTGDEFSFIVTAPCTALSLSAATLIKLLMEVIEPSPN